MKFLDRANFIGTISLLLLTANNAALSQIIPDATLPNNSTVLPVGSSFRVEGGTRAGSTLFHSFGEFSLPTGSEAFFNNALDIQNILTRVTGGKISNIDGLIRANGSANLFLINPSGIIFGTNAQLNIGGSFIASSASSIQLADGSFFSATNPTAPPLLTVNVPIGLQFGQAPGAIVNRSQATDSSSQIVGLQVQPGQTLGLIGGDILFEGGYALSPQGRIALISAGSDSFFSLNPAQNGVSLENSGVPNFQDILLSGASVIDASGVGGGEIQMQGKRISVRDGSQVLAITRGAESGGNLSIRASEAVEIAGTSADGLVPSRLSTQTLSDGSGGNLTIETGALVVRDGAEVTTAAEGAGSGGNLDVRAAELVAIGGANPANFTRLTTETIGAGKGGNLNIETGQFLLQGTAFLSTMALGTGAGGNLSVRASSGVDMFGTGFETLQLLLGGALTGQLSPTARIGGLYAGTAGNAPGGAISIETGSLNLQNGAVIFSPNFGEATAGNINISAANSVEIVAASILSPTGLGSSGSGGNIAISTRQITVRDGGVITATTLGNGSGGNIEINTSESVEISGTLPGAVVPTGIVNNTVVGTGDGGDIRIKTGRLIDRAGGLIVANSGGITGIGIFTTGGRGGNISIEASDSIEITGVSPDGTLTSGPGTTTFTQFPAGNLTISAPNIVMSDGAIVSSATFNSGNGGTLTVNASESLEISGRSPFTGLPTTLVTSSGRADLPQLVATGAGGDLRINTGTLIVRDGATLDVSSFGTGSAGTLDVTASAIRLDRNGSLNAATAAGAGGNILARSQTLQLRGGSNITTNSGNTDGGNIAIDADTIVALENSDISANALVGRGGRVSITTRGIFGSEYRQALTPESDITATGGQPELSGTVEINTPDINPAAGLVELPENFNDISDRIVAGCAADKGDRFAITGRGGLPENPSQPLLGSAVWRDLRPVGNGASGRSQESGVRSQELHFSSTQNPKLSTQHSALSTNPQSPIIEATGWVVTASGDVELVANASNLTAQNLWHQLPQCD